MSKQFVELKFYETYYFANIVHNVISEPQAFIRNINDWFEDREFEIFLQPFPKWSRLHDFIYHIVKDVIYEEYYEHDDVVLDSLVFDDSYLLYVDILLTDVTH